MLAQDEARTLRHSYSGTEHLLLGLLREEKGLAAASVLESLGLTVERVRGPRSFASSAPARRSPSGQIPFTPRAEEGARARVARGVLSLGHSYIDTEHILLGLVRENEGVAVRILLDFGADPETVRREVRHALPGSDRQALLSQRPRLHAQPAAAAVRLARGPDGGDRIECCADSCANASASPRGYWKAQLGVQGFASSPAFRDPVPTVRAAVGQLALSPPGNGRASSCSCAGAQARCGVGAGDASLASGRGRSYVFHSISMTARWPRSPRTVGNGAVEGAAARGVEGLAGHRLADAAERRRSRRAAPLTRRCGDPRP